MYPAPSDDSGLIPGSRTCGESHVQQCARNHERKPRCRIITKIDLSRVRPNPENLSRPATMRFHVIWRTRVQWYRAGRPGSSRCSVGFQRRLRRVVNDAERMNARSASSHSESALGTASALRRRLPLADDAVAACHGQNRGSAALRRPPRGNRRSPWIHRWGPPGLSLAVRRPGCFEFSGVEGCLDLVE